MLVCKEYNKCNVCILEKVCPNGDAAAAVVVVPND
jgi:hypothetical protein